MKHFLSTRFKTVGLSLAIALTSVLAMAQNQQMEEKLMALKQNQATNKQTLAQYTWQETETISIKGDVKDTNVYQVQMVNGQQQKTEVSNQQAQGVTRPSGLLSDEPLLRMDQEPTRAVHGSGGHFSDWK
jgi:hypothetical protein